MNQKRAVIGQMAKKYRGSRARKDRIAVLDNVVEITGYNRQYAAWLLRNYGTQKMVALAPGSWVKVTVGQPRKRRKTERPRLYDAPVQRELVYIWEWFDQMCGKRLVALLPDIVPILVKQHRIREGGEVYKKLRTISAASVDRILKTERQKRRISGTSHTKPSSILKSQIPIVVSSELNLMEPGHLQCDLVGHDGGNPNGQFAFTLDAVELSSGWIDPRILKNKAQRWVKEAAQKIKRDAPVPIRSFHSDNDSAFLNESVQSWCRQEQIPYNRARPCHCNDTCYVEQKNYNIVRQSVGYARYETDEEIAVIEELYDNLRSLINYFYPSMKLMEKTRRGGRFHKLYDTPQSPYRRLLNNPQVSNTIKIRLRHQKRSLDPFILKDTIARLQEHLAELVKRKNMHVLYPGPHDPKALEKLSARCFGS